MNDPSDATSLVRIASDTRLPLNERREAIAALEAQAEREALSPEILARVTPLLRDMDPDVRAWACRVLRMQAEQQALSPEILADMTPLLGDANPDVRGGAL